MSLIKTTAELSYKLMPEGWATILRTSDSCFIAIEEGNEDYQEYLDWVAAGNTPEPADPELIP
jgi:hypothetical protein|tara:strand:- start:89 stop:277 length:189 start_codon:yes stop_codon:yes gene_type:complete